MTIHDHEQAHAGPEVEHDGPPPQWTADWVAARLVEAYAVLARLPMRTRPAEFGTIWPAYPYERADEWERWRSGSASADFQRGPRGAALDEITRMEQAIHWPAEHLNNDAMAARCVLTWAQRTMLEKRERLPPRKLGASRSVLWRARARGLQVITAGLIKARVPVS